MSLSFSLHFYGYRYCQIIHSRVTRKLLQK